MAEDTRAAEVVKKQRMVQDAVDSSDASAKPNAGNEPAMQAGARHYPTPPFPAQHHPKRGDESVLEMASAMFRGSESSEPLWPAR